MARNEAEKIAADAGKLILRRNGFRGEDYVSYTALSNVILGLLDSATDRQVVEALVSHRSASTIAENLTTDRDEDGNVTVKADVVREIVNVLASGSNGIVNVVAALSERAYGIEDVTAELITRGGMFGNQSDAVAKIVNVLVQKDVVEQIVGGLLKARNGEERILTVLLGQYGADTRIAERLDTEALLSALANRQGGYGSLAKIVVDRAIAPELDAVRGEVVRLTNACHTQSREITRFEGEVLRQEDEVMTATAAVEAAQSVADEITTEVGTLEADFENVPDSFRTASEVFLNGRREALKAANTHVRTESQVLINQRRALESIQDDLNSVQTARNEGVVALGERIAVVEQILGGASAFVEEPRWFCDAKEILAPETDQEATDDSEGDTAPAESEVVAKVAPIAALPAPVTKPENPAPVADNGSGATKGA